MSTSSSPLGVIPSKQLLKDLESITEAKSFLEEYNFLLEDDCNEYERQSTLIASAEAGRSKTKTNANKKSSEQRSIIPLAQYMIVPLSLVEAVAKKMDKNKSNSVTDFIKSRTDDELEEKFKKLFSSSSYSPLQITFRSPLPTTTVEERKKSREKFKVARAHQEREAYNRMLRGNSGGLNHQLNISSSKSNNNNQSSTENESMETVAERLLENVFYKKQLTKENDPVGFSNAMRLKASSGGAGFLARDAFSSSSRQEMEHITGISSHDAQNNESLAKKISRDVGLGLDVPLMALAGAVVGWYACALRGYSSNESAIGAAVCATIMLIVDGILVMMKLAKEDLVAKKEKRKREAELQKAVKASVYGGDTDGNSSNKNNKNVRVLKREVLGDTSTSVEKEEEPKKLK